MKKNLFAVLTVLFVCLTPAAFSQVYNKYVVVFTDKNNTPYKINQPLDYLSQRSIDRRIRYKIKVDSVDLPVNPSYIQQVSATGAVNYLSQSKWLNQILIFTTDNNAINAIRALPFVKSVTAIGNIIPTEEPVDKFKETVTPATSAKKTMKVSTNAYDYGYSYDQIHIHNGEYLHNKGYNGAGMVIAIIDAGFYKYRTIKAFDSVRARSGFLGEKDFVAFDGSVNEDDTHGEECLSTIASNIPGTMVGTAPNANFWLLRGENTASEMPIEEHNWAAAAEFADSAGADLISSSLGYYTFDNSSLNHTYSDFYQNTTMVSRAATYAARKGMIVTNSAGNEGGSSWKYIIFPADSDSVCAVAASDVNGKIAYFSSFGYPGKVKPNITSVGDGTALYSYYGLTYGSGTSFSNPNINGLIACLWQAFPQFSNMDILKAVYGGSDRYRTPDNRFGYGIPNMRKSYKILLNRQNKIAYGDAWIFTNLVSGNQKLEVKFLGRTNGAARISLLNADGKAIVTKNITTEEEETYNLVLSLPANAPAGKYSVQYSDGKQTYNAGSFDMKPSSIKIIITQQAIN